MREEEAITDTPEQRHQLGNGGRSRESSVLGEYGSVITLCRCIFRTEYYCFCTPACFLYDCY